MTHALLAGVRVLDLSQFVPGPYATLILSDYGASIIKVEPPKGDPQRTDGPLDEDGVSAWYKLVNRNKRIVEIDLKTPAGKAALETLIRSADVLLASFRPGTLDRLGFGSQRLADLNPKLVQCSLSGFGDTGPLRLKAAHDVNYTAVAGIQELTGYASNAPIVTPALADYVGALHAALAICAAVASAGKSGRGAIIDIGLTDAAASLLGTELTAALRDDFDPRRGQGLYSGGWACYNTYLAKDGRVVALGAVEGRFWANFCNLVGRPDWIQRHREPLPQMALTAELQTLFGGRDSYAWEELLADTDTCFTASTAVEELTNHPQFQVRKIFQRTDDKTVDSLLPVWINGTPPPARRPLMKSTIESAIGAFQNKEQV